MTPSASPRLAIPPAAPAEPWASLARKTAAIAAEAATDGLYVVRTSLPVETLDDADTVRSYKSLARVERAFRCIKTVDLNVRPVYHWLEDRVRARLPKVPCA